MKTIASICAVTLMTAGITAAHAGSKNNSLTIALSEPIDGVSEFDAPSDEGQLHTRAVLDRLLSVDSAQGKLMPLLATSWKQIDPTTWEFDLRSDVKFHDGSVFDARWPAWDESLVVENQVELVVQVNGKTRSRVIVPRLP